MMLQRCSVVEIETELEKIPGWNFSEGKIVKLFKFANFPTAVLFVNNLVDPAEELTHYPEVRINYNRVVVSLFSHTVGGISSRDFELAKRIDTLV